MRHKVKWIFTILAILAFYIFGSAFPDDDLGGRAMAVGLGVDLDDDGLINVTAQIMTSANSSDSTAGVRLVSAKSKTMSSAIANISEKCGLTLTVTHCNVVVIGEKLAKSQRFFNETVVLFENTYVSDNAFLFVCEGTAEELLGTKSGFGTNASLYIQRVVAKYGTFNTIAYKTLRQFFQSSYDLGKTAWLPYLKKIKETVLIPPSSDYDNIGDKDYIYSMNDVMIFLNSECIGVYGDDAAKAINFMLYKVDKGGQEFETSSGIIGCYVLDSGIKEKYDLKKKTVKAELELKVTIKDIVYKDNNKKYEEPLSYYIDDEQKKECQDLIKKYINDLFVEMQAKKADIYAFKQKFYAEYGKEGRDINIEDIRLDVSVQIKIGV